jgi:TonB family protein
VFLAECRGRAPEKAAIKLVPADPESAPLQLARWELAAKLSHPHLIRLIQIGRCQLSGIDLLYVAMEYADEDLSQVLPHRPLTAVEAREFLEPALDALAYLHGRGLVHGHLKPSNFLAVGDQLKLSSDGLCRVGEPCGETRKPDLYDPPELATAGMSPAGDVWSLAATLVEALTQRLPVWERKDQDPVLPDSLPAPFLDIARNCLRLDPKRRWTVADILAHMKGQTAARPPQRRARWRRAVPVAALGLALAGLLAGPRLLRRGKQPLPSTSVPPAQPTAESELPAESLRFGVETTPSPAGLVPGEVVHQAVPEVPQKARDTIQGTVRVSVKVRVDTSGQVADAMLDYPGPSRYFARLAVDAARRWKFEPAMADGRAVPSEWILRFEFDRSATSVDPVRASP